MIRRDTPSVMLSLYEKRLTIRNKLKYKKFSGRYLTTNKFLGSNLKTTYFLGIKNLFKSYIIGVLQSMINVHI